MTVSLSGQNPLPLAVITMSLTTHAVANPQTGVPSAKVESRLSTAAQTVLKWGLPLKRDPLFPSTARREARRVMKSWGLEDGILDDSLLVVSELVTNAVQYAQPPISLSLHLSHDQALLIEVIDGGPSPVEDEWTANRPADEHGRGGVIVDALTSGAGEINQPHGCVHRWAAVESANDQQP
ncbi:ATP-binding protein [Streptomyces avermitilis]|uniref:ATP-binding protein n=1 Tax=Streptomyces avermitilis TaxID=33903 RepID=UPI00382D78CD